MATDMPGWLNQPRQDVSAPTGICIGIKLRKMGRNERAIVNIFVEDPDLRWQWAAALVHTVPVKNRV